jgi:hypothetical protein
VRTSHFLNSTRSWFRTVCGVRPNLSASSRFDSPSTMPASSWRSRAVSLGVSQFSPDGRWIAYETDASGRSEVVVQPFDGSRPTTAPPQRISREGGAQVRWRADGREIFYIALDGTLHAASIGSGKSGTLAVGPAAPLFTAPVGGAQQGMNRQQYMVSADGREFLVSALVDEFATSPITVMHGWAPSPKR